MNYQGVKIIIQARINSSRLPGKVLLPFSGEKSILLILIEKLIKAFGHSSIVIATSSNNMDDAIEEFCIKNSILVFRGSEHNVLKRMIDAAERFNAETIVRVCADNPFLNISLLQKLMETYNGEDYLSFCVQDETPVILTHLGLFGEITSLESLQQVSMMTSEIAYQEHVTNYLYKNKEYFDIKLLKLPSKLQRKDLRFTVDTIEDFKTAQSIFNSGIDTENIYELINFVDANYKFYGQRMESEINENTK